MSATTWRRVLLMRAQVAGRWQAGTAVRCAGAPVARHQQQRSSRRLCERSARAGDCAAALQTGSALPVVIGTDDYTATCHTRPAWYSVGMSDTNSEQQVVVGYVRVSTEEQAAGGLGLAAQRERISAYCHARGWQLAGIIEDAGVSGSSLQRAGMERVRTIMRKKLAHAVVALKLDRLTRRVADLQELLEEAERTGVALVSVSETLDTSSAAGRLMVHVLGAIAQWERETIAERTAQALRVKRARGERTSRHARLGSGEHALQEQRTMAALRMELMQASERPSLRALAHALRTAGCVSRAGTAYTPSSISTLLRTLAADDAAVAARLSAWDVQARASTPRAAELHALLTAA